LQGEGGLGGTGWGGRGGVGWGERAETGVVEKLKRTPERGRMEKNTDSKHRSTLEKSYHSAGKEAVVKKERNVRKTLDVVRTTWRTAAEPKDGNIGTIFDTGSPWKEGSKRAYYRNFKMLLRLRNELESKGAHGGQHLKQSRIRKAKLNEEDHYQKGLDRSSAVQ